MAMGTCELQQSDSKDAEIAFMRNAKDGLRMSPEDNMIFVLLNFDSRSN